HLNRALALVFERHDQIVFLTASEHAHIPRPVKQDGFQVLCTGRGSVQRRGRAAPALPLSPALGLPLPAGWRLCSSQRHGADRENESNRENKASSIGHNGPLSQPNRSALVVGAAAG